MRRLFSVFLLLTFLCAGAVTGSAQDSLETSNPKRNISGMAWLSQTPDVSFVVVHDNKFSTEPHVSVLTLTRDKAPGFATLEWKGAHHDLEAVTRVGQSDAFMALTSVGKVISFRLSRDNTSSPWRIAVNPEEYRLPTPGTEFEGLAMEDINGVTVAVWAYRGSWEGNGVSKQSAKLYCGKFAGKFAFSGEPLEVSVPFPTKYVRGISDVKIIKVNSAYRLLISAAEDHNNDNGPFASAVYDTGEIRVNKGQVVCTLSPPKELFRTFTNKIEAIEYVPGQGWFFGTDDENRGTAIYRLP